MSVEAYPEMPLETPRLYTVKGEAHTEEHPVDPVRAAVLEEMERNPEFAAMLSLLATNPSLREYVLPQLANMYGEYFFGKPSNTNTVTPAQSVDATASVVPKETMWMKLKTKWEEGGLPDVELTPVPASERSWASQQSTKTYFKDTNLELTLQRQRGGKKERDDSEPSEFSPVLDAALTTIDHYTTEYAAYVTELTEVFIDWMLDPNQMPQQTLEKGKQLLVQLREEEIPKMVDEAGKLSIEGKKLADELLRTLRYQIALLPARSKDAIEVINNNPSRSYKAAAALIITASLALGTANVEHEDASPVRTPGIAEMELAETSIDSATSSESPIILPGQTSPLVKVFNTTGANNG